MQENSKIDERICHFLGQHLIAFGSRTQKNIALSSGEAELAAQVCGISEALGIANLLHEWKKMIKVKSFCDSSAARGILQRVGCGRIRHLQLKHLWIQELVSSERLHVQWIPRKENCADILTHPTAVSEFDKGLAGMGVRRLGRAAKNDTHSGRGGVLGSMGPTPFLTILDPASKCSSQTVSSGAGNG